MYSIRLFFTENSSVKEEKLMKFLTGSYRIPVLGAPPIIKVNFKHDCANGCRCFPTVYKNCTFLRTGCFLKLLMVFKVSY